jgi:hypothetical protein
MIMRTTIASDVFIEKKAVGQRGAALVTVLLISTLLLAAGGALVLATTTARTTAIDSTAEMQAYYAAEAGLQEALNVLRGNIAPNAAMPAGTKISFRNAVDLTKSNLPTDTSTTYRLSGWLPYSYPGGSPDRVVLPTGAAYSPFTGLAYSIDVTDPDNTPVASGDPARLVLRATGYGPKGAIKHLELYVRHSNFEYSPPALILPIGNSSCDPLDFTIGDSNAKEYSGHDNTPTGNVLPVFGATCATNQNDELDAITKGATVQDPKTQVISNYQLPYFLQSADNARSFLSDLKATAIEQGRYYSTFDGYAGTDANPAFTFVDGDCTLDGGAGLLIVTGHLEMNGNPNFSGLILVLGNGTVNRDGAGNGTILGAMVAARFDPTGTGGFETSTFTTNGAGTMTFQFDSDAIRRALNLAGPRVLGFHEY